MAMTGTLPLLAALTLVGLGLGGPAAAPAANPAGCVVSGAELDWGFKESFRAYIDGTIANGEWTVADGAIYEIPEFGWRDGGGTVDPSRSSGTVAFEGSVRFTGHDGILDTTIANPVIRFDDARTATLLLDVDGDTMDGEPISVDAQEFVTIDLSGADLSPGDGVISVTEAPTTLTEAGSIAFPNYEAGSDFDAISFTLPVGDCALRAPDPGLPLGVVIAIAVGGAAIVVTGALVAVRAVRRR
jgi:hypothetical protein